MEFLGPLTVQWGLRFAHEAAPEAQPVSSAPEPPPTPASTAT